MMPTTETTLATLRLCVGELFGILRARLFLAIGLIVLITLTEGVGSAGVDANRNYAEVWMRFEIASAALAAQVIYVALTRPALQGGGMLTGDTVFDSVSFAYATRTDGGEVHEWWRTRLCYVAQDTFPFHDTVRANLTWLRCGLCIWCM